MRMTAYMLVALSVLAATGCRAAKVSEGQPVVPELKLDGVRFRVYRGESLSVFGDAETTSLRRDSSELRARQLDATLPRQGGPVLVTAPEGHGSLLSRVFDVWGGVLASRGDDVARTERARYEPHDRDGIVRGDDPVVVEGRGYRLDGVGFTLDPGAGEIEVHGGAKLVTGIDPRAPRGPP
jgi:lipopolysaccharide export system protein LptC